MQGFVITNGIKYINRIDIDHRNIIGTHFHYSNNFFDSAFTYKEYERYKDSFNFIVSLGLPKDFWPVKLTEEELQEIQKYRDLKEIIE